MNLLEFLRKIFAKCDNKISIVGNYFYIRNNNKLYPLFSNLNCYKSYDINEKFQSIPSQCCKEFIKNIKNQNLAFCTNPANPASDIKLEKLENKCKKNLIYIKK